MNTVEILKAAKALIVDKGWTQGEYARGKSGRAVVNAKYATCFCGVGAVSVAAGGSPGADAGRSAWLALEAAVGEAHFPTYNDAPGRTVEEVLALFDKAIAAEEAKG